MKAIANLTNRDEGGEVPAYRPHHYRTSRIAGAFGAFDLTESPRGWLMFDAACPFCTRAAKEVRKTLLARHIYVLPLQTQWAQKLLRGRAEPLLKEIRFLNSEGILFGGADALLEVARAIWWIRPFTLLAHLPGALPLLRHAYAAVAKRRHCAFTRPALKGAAT